MEVAAHVHNYLPCGCLIMWKLLSSSVVYVHTYVVEFVNKMFIILSLYLIMYFMCLLNCDRSPLHNFGEGINVTEAGERVYRALLMVSGEVLCRGRGRWRGRWFTVGNME